MIRRDLSSQTAGIEFRYAAVTEAKEQIKREWSAEMCIMARKRRGAPLLYTKKSRIWLDNISEI